MKKWFALLFLPLLCCASTSIKDCQCKGIALYGDVMIVSGRADFDVRVVDHHQDLNVRKVTTRPKECGQWRIVTKNPDFTIRLVEHHPDFTIKFVDHHHGVER